MKALCVFCLSPMRSTCLVDAIFLRPNHSNNKTYFYFRAVSSVASCIISLICLWFLSHFFPYLKLGVGYIVHMSKVERDTPSTNVYWDKLITLQAWRSSLQLQGVEALRMSRLSAYKSGKIVSRPPLPPGDIHGTHFR
jgi:hypothetical protein